MQRTALVRGTASRSVRPLRNRPNLAHHLQCRAETAGARDDVAADQPPAALAAASLSPAQLAANAGLAAELRGQLILAPLTRVRRRGVVCRGVGCGAASGGAPCVLPPADHGLPRPAAPSHPVPSPPTLRSAPCPSAACAPNTAHASR